ncbi:hypothetical protein NDU88_003508 [Pleurodeles waltl]|uniref:Uncharacterized protein n=1 Tax=Pleurodeles waltl TaxID=8319 RepID=A0AAV7MTM7_PLEWA|nr:hypothetical protein NDU88_003508 [Pleurodeles waltl]
MDNQSYLGNGGYRGQSVEISEFTVKANKRNVQQGVSRLKHHLLQCVHLQQDYSVTIRGVFFGGDRNKLVEKI